MTAGRFAKPRATARRPPADAPFLPLLTEGPTGPLELEIYGPSCGPSPACVPNDSGHSFLIVTAFADGEVRAAAQRMDAAIVIDKPFDRGRNSLACPSDHPVLGEAMGGRTSRAGGGRR
ncbi:MAG: hypothetical protein HY905_19850 [Deltaproteobacteria bacterium]|nr:hypothetical protein [Deltaproteobacteria bacterium]